MPDVFLSYKREDLKAASRLVQALRAAGLDVWWDADIPPDAPWEATIEAALADAKVVLVCWSKAAVASDNVRSEARWARDQGRLIQLFVEQCNPPLFFGERQGIDLSVWSGDEADSRIRRLVSEIQARLHDPAGIVSPTEPIAYESPQEHSQTALTELRTWLKSLDLERYVAAFEAAEVNLETLSQLTDSDLREIGIPFGPRRRILAALSEAPAEIAASQPISPAPGAAPQASFAERRQITVMFVDLVDFTRLSAESDPEVLADLLKIYKDQMAREIAAAGGRVARYPGDGVLAYFGWPQAREDAAECAVRSGFQVIAEVGRLRGPDGLPLRCRIGVATGLVVVGGDAGEDAASELTIAGEAPNLAAKLQVLARPDAMVISDATHRQIGQLFECEALGEQPIPGLSVPVRAWRPLREAPHLSRFRAGRAVRTSFVGREHELSLLADRWRTACEGTGRAVLIFGEAGMGKSRLAEALHDRIGDAPHSFVTWQCSPYHQTKALYPVVEYTSHAAAIVDADTPVVRLKKLKELLGATRMPPEGALALFAQLLAIPEEAGYAPPAMAPAQLRAATIAALSEWVRRVAAREPLLLLLEDAHWIDATTLELLTRIVGAGSDVPLLTVVTGRPEFVSPWGGRADVSIIGLDRLNNRDCEGLVREIAVSTALTSATVKEIVSRSDGNPLYVEELSAAVFETRTSGGQGVPDSLQSSLMARLDQLGDAKRTAQVCSVLGRRFARPLLAEVASLTPTQLDANLALLAAHHVIRPIGGVGEGRYEFKHALLRDAAYESLLLSQRRRLHEACGLNLERSFPEVAHTEPELLARHFGLAGLAEQASVYAELAGDRANAAGAFVEAIANYQEALGQNELLPEGEARERRTLSLLLKLGPAIGIMKGAQDPELREIYQRAEGLSRTAGDLDALFKAVWGLWYNANVARELDDAATFAQQLLVISEQSGDEDHRFEALHCRWSSEIFRGDYKACSQDARRGVELYDRDRHHKLGLIFGGHDPGVCAIGVQGQVASVSGDLEAGLAFVESAVALAESLEHPGSLAHALVMGLIVTTVTRAPELLRPYAERMLELGRKLNVPPQQAMGAYHLAWADAETGDRSKGLDQMGAMYDQITTMGPITLLYKVMYIDQLLKAGRAEEALSAADKATAALRFPDRGFCLPELFRLRGDCLAAVGRPEEAIPELLRAEAMAERDGAELLRLRAAASLHRTIPNERSHQRLEAALAAFPRGWTGPDVVDALALLSR